MSGGAHSVMITGKVTQEKAPAPNLQVVFTNPQTPGTADALNKCLQLDPNGTHASEAKSMLQALGSN